MLLVEKGDLASATSSASTGIVHGGVRYVPQMHFRLVRESLKERRELLKIAPHVVHPMTFAFVHQPGQAPYLGIRFVLKLYDWLAGRLPGNLHGSYGLNLAKHPFGTPLDGHLRRAVAYSDCQTMDARLVVLTAVAAAHKGAEVMPRTECVGLTQGRGRWEITLRDASDTWGVSARAVVNATGPWVRSFIDETHVSADDAPGLRLIKGSHIIVPRQYEGQHAYVIGQPDGRVVFAIPYEDHFTLIGTTDVDYDGDIGDVRISDTEIAYLCDAFNRVSRSKITRDQVRGHYAGLRAQYDDGRSASEVSRESKLHLHSGTDAPLLSVYGGKLTTHRGLGRNAVKMLLKELGANEKPWDRLEPLPGGEMEDFNAFREQQYVRYARLPRELVRRYARTYGTRMNHLLEGATTVSDLGCAFSKDLYEAEVRYLVGHEWARTVDDILWRRTKLKLTTSEQEAATLAQALPDIVASVAGNMREP